MIQVIKDPTDLEKQIQKNAKYIVLITASWCPFCMRFLPVFQKYAQDNNDFLIMQDDQEIVAEKYDVNVIPTVLYFVDGKVQKRLDSILGVGLNENQFVKFIEEFGF